MIGWLIVGLIIYFGYSVQAQQGAEAGEGAERRTEPRVIIASKDERPPVREAVLLLRRDLRATRLHAVVLAQNSSKARTSSPAICCAVDCSMTKRCIR